MKNLGIKGIILILTGAVLFLCYPASARRVRDFLGETATADDIFIYAKSRRPFSTFTKILPSEIRLIKELPEGDKINCLGYLMGVKEWIDHISRLYQFISEKRYEQVTKPRVGDIILYLTTGEDFHVGIISRIDPDGTIWVESKWCTGPVFEHTLDFVPSRYDSKHPIFYGPPR